MTARSKPKTTIPVNHLEGIVDKIDITPTPIGKNYQTNNYFVNNHPYTFFIQKFQKLILKKIHELGIF